jgi:biopolymer transport protein ExbB
MAREAKGLKKILRLLVSAVLLALVTANMAPTAAQASDWWNASWQYRMKLTFDNSASGENLTDFPVLVHFTTAHSSFWANINGGITSTDTKDLRFVDADGASELYFEAEKIDYAGKDALVWVRVPQVDAGSTTDFIYVYYGNSLAAQSAYHDPGSTWDGSFRMVQHLAETSGTHDDATTYNNDGTPQGGVTQTATGQINGADSFDGSDDWINCGEGGGTLDFGTGNFTVEAWVKTTETNSRYIISKFHPNLFPPKGYAVQINSGKLSVVLADGSSHNLGNGSATINNNGWHYIAVTFDRSADATYYVDGANDKTTDISAFTGNIDNNQTQGVAQKPSLMGSSYFNGTIDEIRISATVRSGDWVKAQHLSMTGSFLSFGGVETVPTSTPTTVGGTVYPVDKMQILLPWLFLFSAMSLAVVSGALRMKRVYLPDHKEQ